MQKQFFPAWLCGMMLFWSVVVSGANIIGYQYWFDDDILSATSVSITPTPVFNLNTSLNATALAPGVHMLRIRFQDDSLRYSVPHSYFFVKGSNGTGNSSNQVTGYQYWFDDDFAGAVTQNVTPTSVLTLNTALDATSIQPGLHSFHFRAEVAGAWTVPMSTFVFKGSNGTGGGTNQITGYRFWFDDDFDGALYESVAPSQTVIISTNLSATPLSTGLHSLHFQAENSGVWSTPVSTFFFKGANGAGSGNQITGYQYWFDDNIAGAIFQSVAPTATLVLNTEMLAPSLPSGLHSFHFRAEQTGVWSAPVNAFFFKGVVNTVPNLVSAYRFWFDVNIAATQTVNLAVPTNPANLNFNINAAALSPGSHELRLQFKDQSGNWSSALTKTFTANCALSVTCPANILQNAACSADVGGLALTAVDNCGTPGISWEISGATTDAGTGNLTNHAFNTGVSTLTYTASDPQSGTFSCNFAITINDNVPPQITCPGNQQVSDPALADYTTQATVANDCSTVTVSQSPAPGTTLTVNVPQTVTLTATDVQGNQATCTMQATLLPPAVWYADSDGDTFGNAAVSQTSYSQPTGYVSNATDCNDSNAAIFPGATEICDGADNDCDTNVDENVLLTFFSDADGDNYGNADVWALACAAPANYVANDDDCNDSNASIHPGATEACNNTDDDCDGQTDEGTQSTFYADADGDTFGNPNAATLACAPPANYVINDGDCNDSNANIHPGATELCNNADDDCNGQTDDGTTPPPASASASGATTFCSGSSVVLNANSGANLVWQWQSSPDNIAWSDISGATANSLNVTTSGFFRVKVTNTATLCHAFSNAIETTATPPPNASATPQGPTVFCAGGSVVLLANTGSNLTYQWQSSANNLDFANIAGQTASSFTATESAFFRVKISNAATGCVSFSDGVGVSAIPLPMPNILGASGVCTGNSTTWTATGGSTYAWANTSGSVFSTENSVAVSVGGTYTLTATANGCSASTSKTLGVNPLPTVEITGDAQICGGASAQFSAQGMGGGGSYSFVWDNNLPNGATQNVFPDTTTTYRVTVADGNGCTATGSFAVEVSNHNPTFDFVGDAGFDGHVVQPLVGSPYTPFEFRIKYTDADGDFPSGSFPRLLLHYQASGPTFYDVNIPMTAEDAADTTTADGKIYKIEYTGLPVWQGWNAHFTAIDAAGCLGNSNFQPAPNEPDVIDFLDVSVFANDISFSDPLPDPGDTISVFVKIHNYSDEAAINFTVRLVNDFSNETYPDQTLALLPPHTTDTLVWAIAVPNVDSWNPLHVFIDQTDVLDETNELNNSAVRPIIVGDFTLPATIEITTAIPNVNCGSCNTLTGHAQYMGFPDTLGLNGFPVQGGSVEFFLQETGEYFSTTTDDLGNFSVFVGCAYPTGNFHIVGGEVTDFTLTGYFTDEFSATNNCPGGGGGGGGGGGSSGGGGTGGVGCTLPFNLKAEISMLGSNPAPGQSRTFNIVVSNTGSANVTVPTLLRLTPVVNLSPAAVDTLSVPPLAVGATFTVSRTYTFSAGAAAILLAHADDLFAVPECNESDNHDYFEVQLLPDLDIQPSSLSLSSSNICQNNTFHVIVRNMGGAPAGPSTLALNVKKTSNNQTVYSGTAAVGALVPGAAQVVSFLDVFTFSGEYRFDFVADAGNALQEISEANNAHTFFATLDSCLVDLALDSVFTKNYLIGLTGLGDSLTFPVRIFNFQQAIVPAPFVLRAEILDNAQSVVSVKNVQIPAGFAPGNSIFNVTIGLPTPGQAYMMRLKADADAEISESNEGNNTASTYRLFRDYAPTSLCPAQSAAGLVNFWDDNKVRDLSYDVFGYVLKRGDFKDNQLKVKFEVKAPGSTTWLNLGTASVGPLIGAGKHECPQVYAETPVPFVFDETGVWQMRVTSDPLGSLNESDEANNVLEHDFTVVATPDLTTFSYYINPTKINPNPGDTMQINVTYKNVGQAVQADEPFSIGCKVDNTSIGAIAHPLPGLPTGATYTVSFPFTVPTTWAQNGAEAHLIQVVVDSLQQISELNELNNHATRALIVGLAPDLVVSTLQFSGALVSARVKNMTGGPCAGATLKLFYREGNGALIPITGAQNLAVPAIAANDSTLVTFAWSNPGDATYLRASIFEVNPVEVNPYNNDKEVGIAPPPLTLVGNVTHVCPGASDGTVDLSITGGFSPYSIVWSTGASDATSLSNLAAGAYSATVTDNSGTTASATLTVLQIPNGSIAGLAAICTGDTAVWTVSGAANLLWSTGATSPAISLTTAGTYSVTLTAANGCTQVLSQNLTVNPVPAASVSPTSATLVCTIPNLTLTASGGENYVWSNNATGATLTVNGSNTPVSTLYRVTVSNVFGCSDTASVFVAVNENSFDTDADGACNGDDCDDLNASAYPGAAESCNDNVDNDCDGQINEPIAAMLVLQTNVSCNGYSNGAINVAISCGQPPYFFNWSNGATTEDLANLPAGTYTLTVSDNQGLTKTLSATITQPTATTLTFAQIKPSCPGGANGSLQVNPPSPTTGYTYLWNTGSTARKLLNIAAGAYTVTVTRTTTGCTTVATGTLNNPTPLAISFSILNNKCFGQSLASVTASVTGGTGGKTYLWNTGATLNKISNLSAGTYSLTVTDSKGCTTSATATVTSPPELVLAHTLEAIAGNKYKVTLLASGGTPYSTGGPYRYCRVSTTNTCSFTATNVYTNLLPNTTYFFRARDINGCADTISITTPNTQSPNIDRTETVLKFEFAPNPIRDRLVVRSSTNLLETTTVEVFNPKGQLMQKLLWLAGQAEIELAADDWPSGVYNLRIGRAAIFKVVKIE